MTDRPSFWKGLWGFVRGSAESIELAPGQRVRLSGTGVRIPFQGLPFEIQMGEQRLHVSPEPLFADPQPPDARNFVLYDPDRYFDGIGHFLRLRKGEKVSITHGIRHQRQVFSHPREAFRRYLQVTHEGDHLVFRDPISELGTYISLVTDRSVADRLSRRRHQALDRMREIFDDQFEILPPEEALDLLNEVNRLSHGDPYRRKDSAGNPGALVELPDDITPILVGDLHAQVDNLLTVLTENGYLECLEKGTAALIILGDAVHPEDPDRLHYMDSSLQMMDLIFRLKKRFPAQVFFLAGNHDSFSHDVMKRHVAQGALWEQRVIELRGQRYRDELARFYTQSPLVTLSKDFVACHAAPARGRPSREQIIDARRSPQLVRDLTEGRMVSPAFPGGYTGRDVRRFRAALGLPAKHNFVVGHYPRSSDETVWLDVGKIEGHHVLYSARDDRVGTLTSIDGEIVPQVYPREPLLEILSQTRATSAALVAS